MIQPRAGVATIDGQITLLRYLAAAGADLLPTTIDSYTRLNRYEEAERGLEESENGRSMLNGFPAVNHGVEGCRKVTEAVGVPVEIRHGTPDARLLAEIAFASGFTSFEGGGYLIIFRTRKTFPSRTRSAIGSIATGWSAITRIWASA